MIETRKASGAPGPPDAVVEKLPYRIELWDEDGLQIERVLARAASAALARAIFAAAQAEHVGRHVVLRRGQRVIAETD